MNAISANDTGLPRRAVLSLAALPLAAGCAAPALAQTAIPQPDEMPLADQIAHHVAEIERLLQEAAPENVELTSVCWKVGKGDFWASGDWFHPWSRHYRLAHYRPHYRTEWWIQGRDQDYEEGDPLHGMERT